uniref:Uncharacterized protein n=1 Tax=Rangifer tarandus platyrhynchus TaxID=3082113 RepID=A0ACB0FFT7_RANTA|nr:unnamed protein product [Rangifer tarandus platyrhynchus]
MPIRTLLGECVFKSETPAPSAAGAGALAGWATAGAVIGGPAGSALGVGVAGHREPSCALRLGCAAVCRASAASCACALASSRPACRPPEPPLTTDGLGKLGGASRSQYPVRAAAA